MNRLEYTFAVVIATVLATGAVVRAWDVGVVVEGVQIQFLKEKTVENTAADKLKAMVAIAYNPITKDIYVSDENHKAASIFRVKTTGDTAYSSVEPIVAKQSTTVQGMTFDAQSSTLFWTTGMGHTINYIRVPENTPKVPLTPQILLSFSSEITQGITIDTCRGYLYWTNSNHLNATIERSRLDGSHREVVYREDLFHPLGIALDAERNLLYWSHEDEGMSYSIESANLNNGTRRTLIRGTHHIPFAIALDDRNVYWSDWTNNAVWAMPVDDSSSEGSGGAQPSMVVKYESVNSPKGLITPVGNTSLVNNTYCATHRAKDVDESPITAEPTPDLIPYEALKNICKNKGVLHANGTCTCATGFTGEYCQDAVCDGYCMAGTCVLTSAGQPLCNCPETVFGDRCEKQLCPARCENGGQCEMDALRNPRCKCPDGYAGDVCQYKNTWLNELCPVYCQYSGVPISQQPSVCRCDEYRSLNTDYSKLAMLSRPEVSPCKLSKSVLTVISILTVLVASLGVFTMILVRKVRLLGRRPRIKKRIVVNKSITPLTCRPPQEQNQQQCEITIENCCNMNICETPCFEPDYRPPARLSTMIPSLGGGRSKKEDKANLLSNTDMTSSEDEKPSY